MTIVRNSRRNRLFISFIPYNRSCIAQEHAVQAIVLDSERTFQPACVPSLEIRASRDHSFSELKRHIKKTQFSSGKLQSCKFRFVIVRRIFTQLFAHRNCFTRVPQKKPTNSLATTQNLILQQVIPDVLRDNRALRDPRRYICKVCQQLLRTVLAGNLFKYVRTKIRVAEITQSERENCNVFTFIFDRRY